MARALNLLPSFPNTSKICLLFTLQLDLSIRHIHLDGYIRHTTNSPGQDQKHLKLEPISEVKNKNNFWTRGLLQFINSKCNHFCRLRVYNNQIHIRSVLRRIRTTSLALAKRLKYACIMNPASPCICKSVIELCARFGIAIAHAVTGSFNLVNLYRHLYIYIEIIPNKRQAAHEKLCARPSIVNFISLLLCGSVLSSICHYCHHRLMATFCNGIRNKLNRTKQCCIHRKNSGSFVLNLIEFFFILKTTSVNTFFCRSLMWGVSVCIFGVFSTSTDLIHEHIILLFAYSAHFIICA